MEAFVPLMLRTVSKKNTHLGLEIHFVSVVGVKVGPASTSRHVKTCNLVGDE